MRALLITFAGISFPATAMAHTGVGNAASFLHGFGHPIMGLDHVLAMAAVGLFAFASGRRALWLLPAAFLGAMALSGLAGASGFALPLVEAGIGVSIVAIGAAVAFGGSLPVTAAAALVAVFAVFHGHAHGTEMAAGMSGLGYGIGFLIATALLHGAGIAIGLATARLAGAFGPAALRAGGGAVALAGAAVLGGLL